MIPGWQFATPDLIQAMLEAVCHDVHSENL